MAISQQDLIASVPTGLLIGGSWRDSSDGGTLKVEDPSTGEILTEVADATVATARRPSTPLSQPRPTGPRFPRGTAGRSSGRRSTRSPSARTTSRC